MPTKKQIKAFHKCLEEHNKSNSIPKIIIRERGKTLHLSLTAKPFEVMVTGEKKEEFRTFGKWIESRLYNKDGSKKDYEFIKFTNGYGANRPYFICKYKGVYKMDLGEKVVGIKNYSNGLVVQIMDRNFVIELGNIMERGNLK